MVSPKRIFITLAVVSFAVYIAGILTGISVQRFFSSNTEVEISKLKENIDSLKSKMENLQVQTLYFSLSGQTSCDFLVSSSNEIGKKLSYFWDILPQRLEEFEKYFQITSEYQNLKKDYTLLSIRAWLIATNLETSCGKVVKPFLYFYSADCERCIEQGMVLDKVREENPEFSAFIVDFSLDEPIVKLIKDAFNVTVVPSFIYRNQTYSGFQSEDVFKAIISK